MMIRTSNGGMAKRRRKEKIFYWAILALPILQFCIFYIGVNFNSILLSFQSIEINPENGKYIYSWVQLENFKHSINLLFNEYELTQSFKNSIIAYLVGLITGTVPSLLFSYYIYKKGWFGGVFKVILFLPSIVSSVTMVIVFKYFVENAYPELVQILFDKQVEGLLANPNTTFGTLLLYSIWAGFGGGILMYLGAMNSISESVVEAAQIDGITPLKEFFYITFPLIYPTFVTFFVAGLAGIFSNQLNLYTFFGVGASKEHYLYGYYMFLHTSYGMTSYPHVASLGLLFTLVLAPITFLVRWVLNKVGPSVD